MKSWFRPVFVAACLALTACSSTITLTPATPAQTAQHARSAGVAAVNVSIAESMPADRAKMLTKLDAVNQLQKAVLASFAGAGLQKPSGVTLNIAIDQYRISNWGPSRMGVKVSVVDGSGKVLENYDRESGSMRGGSTATRTQRLAQDLVQKIVDEA